MMYLSLMIKLLIFDLDNTLYDEYQYVLSGFKAVAKRLSLDKGLPTKQIFAFLKDSFDKDGRGKNFDALIDHFSIISPTTKELVETYRQHIPTINLYSQTVTVLQNLCQHYKLCILTNGLVPVQKLKIQSLCLKPYFDNFFFAQENGLEFQKPHKQSFLRVLSYYDISPQQALMVGDDMECDIIGARNVGINTFFIKKPDDLLSLESYLKNTP